MSGDTHSTRITRYPLPPAGEPSSVLVPAGSLPRWVGMGEQSQPSIWFEIVVGVAAKVTWTMKVVGTGVEAPLRSIYVGSFKQGSTIWHVFAKTEDLPTKEAEFPMPFWRVLEEILEASKMTNVLLKDQNELLVENNTLLKEISEQQPSPEPPKEAVSLEVIPGPVHNQGEESPMSTTMKNNQQCDLTLVAKDADGNPAQVDSVAWASSDETILTVETPGGVENSLKAVARAVGPAGDARITATCDADLGEGVRHITGFAEFTIQGGEAVVIELQPGGVTDQPGTKPSKRR